LKIYNNFRHANRRIPQDVRTAQIHVSRSEEKIMTAQSDLYNLKPSGIVVYSAVWCPDCKRAKKFFGEHRVQYDTVDIEDDPRAVEFVQKLNSGQRIIPTIVFPDGQVLAEPSNAQLAEKLGLRTRAEREYYDVIVIGGGPAGLTSALYLAREGLDTLVIERAGLGGQAGITQTLDNFPGFDEGITGEDFANRLGRQARKFGVEILLAQEAAGLEREGQYLCVTTGSGHQIGAHAVLVATGARYRQLNVRGEDELIGINVHFCATCDGAFYKGKKLLVIGGGNSGFAEGVFLTRFARQVDILVSGPEPKASGILQDKVNSMKNMHVLLNQRVKELRGAQRLDGIVVQDRLTGEEKLLDHDGVFVFIGVMPNNELIHNMIQQDAGGFVMAEI
jgi:thioredoxin reductase (NADPH)